MKTLPVICSECKSTFQKLIYYINQNEKRGSSNHFCSNKCNILFNRKRSQENKNKRIEEYYKNPKICPNCDSVLKYEDKKTYCSSKCAATYTQKDGGNHKWSIDGKKKLSILAKNNIKQGRHIVKRNGNYKPCLNCDAQIYFTKYNEHKKFCSKKCSNFWIVKTGYMKGKTGGNRPNSGTSKKGWYKGIFCGSSWELAWVIYNLDHNILFQRNKEGFPYKFNGNSKKYYPDFIVGDEYVEIKNYETEQVKEKTKQFPHKLKILYKTDLKDIFEYVINKYGKNYVTMYELKKI